MAQRHTILLSGEGQLVITEAAIKLDEGMLVHAAYTDFVMLQIGK